MSKLTKTALLVAILLLTLLAVPAFADQVASGTCGADGDNLTWTLDSNGVLTISGTGEMADYDDTSPWFGNGYSISDVVIENGVTSIDDKAFVSCELSSLELPDSLTYIGAYAFKWCENLTELTIPAGVTAFGEGAFMLCRLSRLELPDSLTCISALAFYGCDNLTEVTIPAGVTSIETNAFSNCDHLTKLIVDPANPSFTAEDGVLYNKAKTELLFCLSSKTGILVIPDGVTAIGEGAFARCRLSSLELPDSLTCIGENAFDGCGNLTELTIPAGVTTIGKNTFGAFLLNLTVDPANPCFTAEDGVLYNKAKTELLSCLPVKGGILAIPEGVTAIGDDAFYSYDLTYTMVPLSVTSIGNNAVDCMGIICYAGSEEQWNQVTFGENNDLTYISILYNYSPDTILGSGTCGADGDNLTWTMGSDGVLTISGTGAMADYAFDEGPDINAPYVNYFMSISSVVIESGVTRVGTLAFNSFQTLETVTIADTVTSLGGGAFGNCVRLTSIAIPDSVTVIGDSCFYDNRRLPAIQVDEENPNYCSEDGVLFNKDKTVLISCPGGKWGSYTVPQSVTSVEKDAFFESDLLEIILQEGLTSIGDSAFCYSNLNRLELPASLTQIGASAFNHYDSKLTDIYYAGSKEQWSQITIGEYNEDLENITIHYNYSSSTIVASGSCGANGANLTWTLNSNGSLTVSGAGAMADYDHTNRAPWYEHRDSILTAVVESGVTHIGDCAFNECQNMTSIVIPDTVTSFGESAFSVCFCLTSISIPNSVTEIGEGCFFSCTSLTELTIPASVTSIGSNAFNWSWNLEAIHVDADNPNYSSEDGVLFNKAKTNLIRYPEKKSGSYTVPQSVTSIAECAFYESGLSAIVLPDRLTSIGNSAFYECNLSSLELPNSLTNIGEFAFGLCYNLTELTIPAGVITVGKCPFYGCESLTNLTVDPANPCFTAEDGVLYNKEKTVLLSCPSSKTGTFAIPDSVGVIGENAFSGCQNLTAVGIPISVASIGDSAFNWTSSMMEIYYAGSEEQWKQIAIEGNNGNLDNISIHYNSSLVTIIASGVCGANGDNLTWTLNSNGTLTVSGDGAMADYSFENSTPWFEYRDSIIAVVIESGVTNIGSMSFSSCNHLESVAMPDSVTHIGIYAFAWCQSLTEMALPDHLNYIGESAFDSCRGLQSVTLPGSLTALGRGAFAYASLTEVKVQSGTETVDHYFYEPDNQGQPRLYRVALPKNTTVGEMPFLESALPTNMHPDFTTPSALATIDEEAFFGTAASFIWLADGVTSIGDRAFAGCEGLRFIRIPRQCTSIGTDAIPAGVTILCEWGSTAEQYASDHNCTPLHFTIGGNG